MLGQQTQLVPSKATVSVYSLSPEGCVLPSCFEVDRGLFSAPNSFSSEFLALPMDLGAC